MRNNPSATIQAQQSKRNNPSATIQAQQFMRNIKYFLLIMTACLLQSSVVYAQHDWELPIYAEDAMGNRDTVVLFYDVDHQTGNGEIIDNSPFDTILDVRIRKYDEVVPSVDNVTFKKMHFENSSFESELGTVGFSAFLGLLMVQAKYPPVTFSYDSTRIGYPSFVNLVWMRSLYPWLLWDWYDKDFGYNELGGECEDAYPDYYCMMRRSSITETMEYFKFLHSIWDEAYFSSPVILSSGDTTLIPGFYIYSFTSWADDYYCDKHAAIYGPNGQEVPFNVQSNIEGRKIYIEGAIEQIRSWQIYDLKGKLVGKGDALQNHWLNIDDMPGGVYAIYLNTKDYGRISGMFMQME